MENLNHSGVNPISMDQKWMEDSIAEHKTRTLWIQSLQQQLSDDKTNENLLGLEQFYEDMLSQKAGASPPEH